MEGDPGSAVRKRPPPRMLIVAVAVGVLVAAGFFGYRAVVVSHALGPNSIHSGSSMPAKVDQRIWFGYAGFLPHGSERIHITGLHLRKVSPGLVVTQLAAAPFTRKGYPLAVTDFVISSIRVDYTVGWRHGSTTYPYTAEVDAS